MKRIRWKSLFLFTPLLLLGGLPALLVWREVRQQSLDTVLIEAIKRNDTPAVLQALANGADANARDMGDNRPSWGDRFRQLWERLRGRKIEAETDENPMALLVLFGYAHPSRNRHIRSSDGDVPPENVAVLKALLDRGANPNITYAYGHAPLHCACAMNYPTSVGLLLQYGAKVEASDEEGNTPLLYVRGGSASITRLLLQAGANPQAKDANDTTPLHWAAMEGNLEAVRLLIAKGAQVNARGYKGQTPLIMAVANATLPLADSQVKTIRFLLASGANVNAANAFGDTPLSIARSEVNPALIRLLKQHGAK